MELEAVREENSLADEIIDDLPKLIETFPHGVSGDALQEWCGKPRFEINRALRVLKDRGEIIVEFENGVGLIRPKGTEAQPRTPAPAEAAAPQHEPADNAPEAEDEDEPEGPAIRNTPPAPAVGAAPVVVLGSSTHINLAKPAIERIWELYAEGGTGVGRQITGAEIAKRTGVAQHSISTLVAGLVRQGRLQYVSEPKKGQTPVIKALGSGKPGSAPSTRVRPTDALVAAVAAAQAPAPQEEDVKQAWRGGVCRDSKDLSLTRFASAEVEPDRVRDLRPDHPMVALERTVYPTTVVSPWESPRLLVSGANNAKLGGEVLKGPWSGAPLFHLTLEERATCPRSCLQWLSCYGNAMHLARRHDHRDPNFLNLLEAELWLLQREHRETGFVVRLHTLGDFYSLDYVQFWADALDHFPGLRVFGYTANDPRSKNVEEAAVGKAIEWLTQRAWDVFAIRFSRAEPLPQSSNVLMEPSDDERVIMCPQQREATLACGACGLCWADPARDKAIGFLKHGPKAPGPRA